jgi:hypothetical protein
MRHTPIDFAHQKNQRRVVHPRKYRLELALERIMKNNPEEVSRMLMEHKLKIHMGAVVGIEHALPYMDAVKKELGDNLKASLIFGGVARGLKDEHLPRDIDVMFIVKDDAKIKTKSPHNRIETLVYEEHQINPDTMAKDDTEASFQRLVLSLPILVVHGKSYVQHLRDHARKFLRVADFSICIQNKAVQLEAELRKKGEKVPSFPELCYMVAEDMDICEEILQILNFPDKY